MGFSDFGEGFWVTMAFLIFSSILLGLSIVRESTLSTQIATSIIVVLGMIATFWFPTRGQTSNGKNPPT